MTTDSQGYQAVEAFDNEMMEFFGVPQEPVQEQTEEAAAPTQEQPPSFSSIPENYTSSFAEEEDSSEIEEILGKYRTVQPIVEAIEQNPALGDYLAQQTQEFFSRQQGQPAQQQQQAAPAPARPEPPQKPANADPYSPEMQDYMASMMDYQQKAMQYELTERDRKLNELMQEVQARKEAEEQMARVQQFRSLAQKELSIQEQEAEQFVKWASDATPQLTMQELHMLYRYRNGTLPVAPSPAPQSAVPDIGAQRPTPQQQSRIDEYRNGQRLHVPLPASSQGQMADTRRPEDLIMDALLFDSKSRNPFS